MHQQDKIPVMTESSCRDCDSRKFAWFEPGDEANLAQREKQRLGQYKVRAGGNVFREGDVLDRAYTLKQGWAICYKLLANGQRQVLHIALAGDFIGCQVNHDQPIDYTVATVTDCVFCAFSAKSIESLLIAEPSLMKRLFEINAKQSEKCRTRLAYVGQAQARYRVALFLTHLIERLERRGVDTSQIVEFPLTREDIADAVGITSVHLSRISAELRAQNIVECRYNRLVVTDLEALKRLAGELI